jgi:hypothetical protein
VRPRDTLASFVLAAVLAFVGAGRAHPLWETAKAQDRLPQWDMAHNALLGAGLARDLRAGNVLQLLRDVNAHTMWPFGFSLLLAPFFLARGFELTSAVLPVVIAFAALPLVLGWVCREADPGARGAWVALISSGLVLASPLLQLLSIVVLRETTGAVALLAATALYLRARRKGTIASWRLAGLATLAVFFVKYNYALVWIAAMIGDSYQGRRAEGKAVSRRALVETVAAPVAVWLVFPGHLKGVLRFVSNRSSRLPAGEGLFYYVRAFLAEYAPSPAIGVVVLALFAAGLVLAMRGGPGRWRIAGWVAAVHLAAIFLHPYKETRFLATAVPFVSLLAALPVATLAGRLLRSRASRLVAAGALASGLVLLVATEQGTGASDAWVRENYRGYSVDRRFQGALDALARLADRDASVAVLGTFQELSPALVEWTLLGRDTGAGFEVVPRMPPVRPAVSPAVALETWLARRRPGQVLTIALDPDSPVRLDPDYHENNRWQETVLEALDGRGDFARDGEARVPSLGITVASYRRTSPVARR